MYDFYITVMAITGAQMLINIRIEGSRTVRDIPNDSAAMELSELSEDRVQLRKAVGGASELVPGSLEEDI